MKDFTLGEVQLWTAIVLLVGIIYGIFMGWLIFVWFPVVIGG